MKATLMASALGAAFLVAGCASTPTEPYVVALPGTNKSLEAFQADDNTCRAAASAAVSGPGAPQFDVQWHYDRAYVQCMYAHGQRVPLIGGPYSYRYIY